MNNVKKFISSLLLISHALVFAVQAGPSVDIADSSTNTLSVKGEAPEHSKVMLYVLNDGCTLADMLSSADGVILYSRDTVADQNGYSFDFRLNNTTGGDHFTAVVAANNAYETVEFSFYPESVKQSFITSISAGNITSADVEEGAAMFTLKGYALYDDAAKAQIASALAGLRDENGGFDMKSETVPDVDKFTNLFKQAMVLAAFNTDNAKLYDADGTMLYADIIGISDEVIYEDYVKGLNDNGKASVRAALFASTYPTKASLAQSFNEIVLANLFTNNANMGYSHMSQLLTKYESELTSAGFDISDYNKLSSSKKDAVCKKTVSSNKTALTLLADVFNDEVANQSSKSNSSGQSSSGNYGGAGSGSNNTPGYVVPDTPAEPQNPEGAEFADVSSEHWAAEYIAALSQKGVINGYADGSFKPEGNVTRAEFAKIMVSVMGLAPDAAACSFADSQNLWSTPYIGAALKAGIISGTGETSFSPESEITREQAAAIIGRALGVEDKGTQAEFTDDGSISDWAKDYIYALSALGIINGKPDGSFSPDTQLTRAEAAKLICVAFTDK